MKRLLLSLIMIFLLVSNSTLAQDSLLIYASSDNTLYESTDGSISNGLGQIFTGVTNNGDIRRAILKFDLTKHNFDYDLASENLDSVKLQIQVNKIPNQSYPIDIHLLQKNWGEGNSLALTGGGGQGTQATENDATWLNNFYPDSNWDNPGGDFNNDSIATIIVRNDTGAFLDSNPGEFKAAFMNWIQNPDENFGILLKNRDESQVKRAIRFSSKDSAANETIYPKLIIYHSGEVLIPDETQVSNEYESESPAEIRLSQNYPNPFNPSTSITFALPEASSVELSVYNMLGEKLATLEDGNLPSGEFSYTFDASTLSSGIYIYRLKTNGNVLTRKMSLIK